MTSAALRTRIGTAGWNIPKEHAARFPHNGSHLERYSAVLNAVEINSSFYRSHRRATYERWAASVPAEFRFAAKIPKAITHEHRLTNTNDLLDRFIAEVSGLGSRIGPLLLQLPPSLKFQEGVSDQFLHGLRDRIRSGIVCEPRHASWFTPEVDSLFVGLMIGRVAADPAPVLGAGEPGGWRGLSYHRLHGSPRIYYSSYGPDALVSIAGRLSKEAGAGAETWCIFDNTAAFAAAGEAVTMVRLMRAEP